ncbi:MAG: C40 family peptidase [Burkholderiales bacterium]
MMKKTLSRLLQASFLLAVLLVAGCGTAPSVRHGSAQFKLPAANPALGREVVMYAFGLINTDYRFGGSNPESGLDCSGMVSYIFENAVGLKLPHNAAQIAELGRDIDMDDLQPGDLVFFNTEHRSFSHVGIYIGNNRFIHAPSSNGKIKISSLKNSYYAHHLEAARSLFSK